MEPLPPKADFPTETVPARDNPFRSARVEALTFRFDPSQWRVLTDRLVAMDHRGALVGPKGTGKTTLLTELERRLEAEGWRIVRWRLREERKRPTDEELIAAQSAGPGDLITVDGAEQLPWLHWRRLRRLSRRCGGLIITTHRPGRLPTLHGHQTSPELLADLVSELLERPVSVERIEGLFRVHRGNIRDCLRALYDDCPI